MALQNWTLKWPRWQLAICGFSRSGTTLLHQLLRQSTSDVYIPPDERSYRAIPFRYGKVITKRPLDVFALPATKRFRKLRPIYVLFVVRDPCDLITSRHTAVHGDYFIGADYVYHICEDGSFYKKPDGGILSTYEAYLKLFDAKLPISVLRYEDLVCKPQEVQSWFESVFSLRFPKGFNEFGSESQISLSAPLNGVRAPETSRIGRWRENPELRGRVKSQFLAHPELEKVASAFQYETPALSTL